MDSPNYIGPGMRYWTYEPIAVEIPEESDLIFRRDFSSVSAELCADTRNVIKAVTLTFRPEFHKLPIKSLNKIIRNIIKQHVCNSRSRVACEVHFELGEGLKYHAHATFIGRKCNIANLCATFRRSCGFVKAKNRTDYSGWQKYITKEDVHRPRYYYN